MLKKRATTNLLEWQAVPAMYLLKLMSDSPSQDVGRLIAISACAAFFGACFAVPLRAHFVKRERLAFPTPTATAYTIRTLHAGIAGAAVAAKKSKALAVSFGGVFCWKILGGYAPGVFVDWHVGWWLSRIGFSSFVGLENYGWWLEGICVWPVCKRTSVSRQPSDARFLWCRHALWPQCLLVILGRHHISMGDTLSLDCWQRACGWNSNPSGHFPGALEIHRHDLLRSRQVQN
jgi:hypothetical protein